MKNDKNKPSKFNVYSKEYYDNLFEAIRKIPKNISPDEINKFIRENLSVITFHIRQHKKDIIKAFPIYRIRAIDEKTVIDETSICQFCYPPEELAYIGRCNRDGYQVLYASGDKTTPFYEVKNIEKDKTVIYLTKWKINESLESVNVYYFFLGIDETADNYASVMASGIKESLDNVLKNFSEEQKEKFLYGQTLFRELFTSEGDEYYHITSAIIHNIFEKAKMQGFDIPIVAYPSVAKNKTAVNFVFRKDFVDENMYLEEIYKGTLSELTDKGVNFTTKGKGKIENGKILWLPLKAKVEQIKFDDILLHIGETKTLRKLEANEFLTECCEEHKMGLKEYLEYNNITYETMLEYFHKQPVTIDKDNYGANKEVYDYKIVIDTEGSTFLSNNITDSGKVHLLVIPVTYTISFQ